MVDISWTVYNNHPSLRWIVIGKVGLSLELLQTLVHWEQDNSNHLTFIFTFGLHWSVSGQVGYARMTFKTLHYLWLIWLCDLYCDCGTNREQGLLESSLTMWIKIIPCTEAYQNGNNSKTATICENNLNICIWQWLIFRLSGETWWWELVGVEGVVVWKKSQHAS